MIDGNYNAYFDTRSMSKTLAMTRRLADVELTSADRAKDEALTAMNDSKRTSSRMAASASALVRTSAVSVTTPLAPGSLTDVDWLYDGTNLARGFDVEEVEFITNDPDKAVLGNHPIFTINYAGGCLPNFAEMTWDYTDLGNGVINSERLYNTGKLGDDTDAGEDLNWQGAGTQDVYDAAFYLAGEEDPLSGNKQYHVGDIYARFPRLFLPDPFPGPVCDFQGDVDVLMGYKRDGGCPGTPVEIRGEWLRTAFIDTNEARVGTPQEAIGTRTEAIEVGAYDPLYGDFKLQHFEVTNRDAVDKGPIYGGSIYDWDVAPNYKTNVSNFSLAYNGYAIWDGATPTLAMGCFDPNLPTAYGGVDPTFNRPQRINPMGEGDGSGAAVGLYDGPFQNGADADPWDEQWDYCVTRLPQFENGPVDLVNNTSEQQDHGGLLTLKGQILPANGTISFDQAIYAVDGSSNNFTTIEGLGLEVAQRAAKWAGFARGDVNDDGDVNLLDVCWLLSGQQIYPDDYNGDVDLSSTVDNADEAYLLDYVTGLGPAPLGAWRFTF